MWVTITGCPKEPGKSWVYESLTKIIIVTNAIVTVTFTNSHDKSIHEYGYDSHLNTGTNQRTTDDGCRIACKCEL